MRGPGLAVSLVVMVVLAIVLYLTLSCRRAAEGRTGLPRSAHARRVERALREAEGPAVSRADRLVQRR